MKRIFAKLILKFLGWKIIGNNIFPKKCIIVVAPHTSNWDFIWEVLCLCTWDSTQIFSEK